MKCDFKTCQATLKKAVKTHMLIRQISNLVYQPGASSLLGPLSKRTSDARIPGISHRDSDTCSDDGDSNDNGKNTFVFFSIVKSDVVAAVGVAFL